MGKEKPSADDADRGDAVADAAALPTEAHTAGDSATSQATQPSVQATDRVTHTDATEMHESPIVSDGGTVPTIGFNANTPVELLGQIAHFRVLETLGSGGFGTVVRAYDTQLDREVAVKIIRSRSLGSRQIARQFQEEARAAAQLRHPNIVTVHQSGDYGDDQVYIVYDYIRGTTLRDVLRKRRPLPPKEAVAIMARIARALGYAHAKGIAHRDVKPENVLIEEETDEPHVADFGCARRTQWDDKDNAATSKPANANNFVGTPVYFSPEQASGHSETAGAPADVWALGVMLDELLTGDRSFQEFESDRSKLMEAIQHLEPTVIRERSPEMDKDLSAIWQHCIFKDPKQRYSTAAALADDLENWMRGFPVSVRPINIAERFWRWGKLNPALASSIAAVFVAVTLGFVFSTIFYYRELESKRDNVLNSIDRLYGEPPDGVAAILGSLQQEYLSKVSRTLLAREWQKLENKSGEALEKKKLRIALAQFSLLQGASDNVASHDVRSKLLESLYHAAPDELALILSYLPLNQYPQDVDYLRSVADDPLEGSRRRLRAICAIVKAEAPAETTESKSAAAETLPANSDAIGAPNSERNRRYAEQVVQFLQSELGETTNLSDWVPLLKPIRDSLREPLESALATRRTSVGRLLFFLYRDDLEFLIRKIDTTEDDMMPDLLANLKDRWKKEAPQAIWRRLQAQCDHLASVTSGAARTRTTAKLWLAGLQATDDSFVEPIPILNDENDPGAAAFLASRAFSYNIPLSKLTAMLRASLDQSQLAAAQTYLLAISHYPSESDLPRLTELLINCQQHPDSGIHAAADWVMARWKIETPKSATVVDSRPDRNWRIGPEEMLMIRCPTSGQSFKMGSTAEELALAGVTHLARNQDDSEIAHEHQIPWQFEVSSTEVTTVSFQRFLDDRIKVLEMDLQTAENAEDDDAIDRLDPALGNLKTIRLSLAGAKSRQPEEWHKLPVTSICLYDAIAYCTWLSNNLGLESCYGELADIEQARQMFKSIYCNVGKNGYRLARPAEWECVCRANSETVWSFGNDELLAREFATYSVNADDQLQPIQSRKPNRWGFFDLLGNAAEWTTSPLTAYRRNATGPVVEVEESGSETGEDRLAYEIRGGDYTRSTDVVRSASRDHRLAHEPSTSIGFRLARTILAESP